MAGNSVNFPTADALVAHFDRFIEVDKERTNFIETLLQRLAYNENQIRRLELDLEDQTRSRIRYQSETNELENRLNSFQKLMNKDAYVAVIVDGDGAKFRDDLLADTTSGAVEAAQNIQHEVRQYLETLKSDSFAGDDVPVVTRVFANVRDLGRVLRSSGVVRSEDDMYMFAENFTNSRPDFDFVNVGRGKENADSKIRRMLGHYYKDYRCKKIFFVACHDAGYAHDLRGYVAADAEHRIVLVETTPAEESLQSLKFPMVRFKSVFREEPLKLKPMMTRSQSAVRSKSPAKLANNIAGLRSAMATPVNTQPLSSPPATANSASSPPGLPDAIVITSSENGSGSVRHATFPTAGNQSAKAKAAKSSRPARTIEYNEDGHRLDAPIKTPSYSSAHDTYKRKCEGIKPKVFCNAFYIGGQCPRGDQCEREHETTLTADEVAIHRFKARTSACYKGPECDSYDCHLSHHCPTDPNCSRPDCKFSKTKFGDLHLTKTKLMPYERWTEDNSFPTYIRKGSA
ncbi:hypothetical protein RJ55_07370 [Drechmeria coniospora]|nr:hypothetical protein RJ55_07370 [Drechmeria coniospora]